MKTVITLIIGVLAGISLQLATAHTPCDEVEYFGEIKRDPIKTCGFETHYDTYGNAREVWVCTEY